MPAVKKVKKNNHTPAYDELEKSTFWTRYSGVVVGLAAVLILGGILYWRQDSSTFNLSNISSWFTPEVTITPPLVEEGQEEIGSVVTPFEEELSSQLEAGSEIQGGVLTEPTVSVDSITLRAQKGEGVTHLARGALQGYLETQKPALSLTREHKIYIEDYLKDAMKRPLHIGDELTFSFDLIKKAIDASQNLSEAQLKNLTKYANRVPSLQAYMPAK